MNGKLKSTDLIIPIYSCTYEDIVKCIASVWKCTDLKSNRLILPYNKAIDKKSLQYIENISDGNIVSVTMKTNADFFEYVNAGMSLSLTNDVVLIEPRSILTSNWLDKLTYCAYQEEWIGIVSPLFDKMLSFNAENLTKDELANFVEKYSLKLFPQIPLNVVANVNCIFIKRSLIHEIGCFDMQTGAYGYFVKALLMGYKYVLCDDTIVYSERNSISDRKYLKALEERYQVNRLKDYVEYNSNAYIEINKNIECIVNYFNRKRNILYVLNAESKEIDELNLKDKYNIFVLSKKDDVFFLAVYIENRKICFTYRIENNNANYFYRDKKEELLLERILRIYRIDLLHIFNISKMSLGIYYIANKLKIPVITSVQEFNVFCPMRMIHNLYGKSCTGTAGDNCSLCLKQPLDIYEEDQYINKCKRETLKALRFNQMILFCSKADKVNFDKIYDVRVPKQILEQKKWAYIYELNFKRNKEKYRGGVSATHWGDRLYTPTQIRKYGDTYFIVDCWHHRILYNNSLNEISDWKLLVDYRGGHSITSDGRIFLCDDTDNSALRVFIKEDGEFKQTQLLENICFRPHYTLYDENTKLFYVIGSNNGEIFTLQNQNNILEIVDHHTFEGEINAYTRSFSIIDRYMYILGDKIYKIDYQRDFNILETYVVPYELQGMNYIEKIGDYYYISIYTDGEINKNPMFIKVRELNLLNEWEFENLYNYMVFCGTPYNISYFDDRYFITEIDQKSGIKSFIVKDNIVEDIRTEYYFDKVLPDSIDRFRSKYE